MSRRRHKKGGQTEETHNGARGLPQTVQSENLDQEGNEGIQTVLSTSCMPAFIEIEIRASQRLQEVARKVDEFLKI